MKIRFEMRLYLPFLLPRTSPEWGSEAVWCDRSGLKTALVVLPRTSVGDAPKSIDDLDIRRPQEGDGPTAWQVISMPHKHLYEAIAIGVFGELRDENRVQEPAVQAQYRNAAIHTARAFFEFCRALAADTEIFFHSTEVSTEYCRFVGFPHYETWYDEETGRQVGDGTVNFGAGEDVVGRHGITKTVPWEVLKGALGSGQEAPIDLLLLLDAEVAMARWDDRKSVLFAAVTVEVAVKVFLSSKNASENVIRARKVGFVEKYFDLLPRSNGLPSLKDAVPNLYMQIQSLFRVRNNIAHEGICYERVDSNGRPDRLSRSETAQLIDAARKAVAWADAQRIQ